MIFKVLKMLKERKEWISDVYFNDIASTHVTKQNLRY